MLPLTCMCVATYTHCPMSRRFLGALRFTSTHVGTPIEMCILGTWLIEAPPPEGTRTRSGEWSGFAVVRMLGPEPPAGHQWYLDKRVKSRYTTRSDNIAPGIWRVLSKAQRDKDNARWHAHCDRKSATHTNICRHHILEQAQWGVATSH